ncbi:MAG: 2,3-bisphosphoglycerate-independent phosphoglycerate mutase [Halanaerobiales bacterium]
MNRLAIKRKAIIIIEDGVGDRLLDKLEGRTPLQAANSPALDRIACDGICGLMDPLSPGIRVGTDVGHLALFGLDPVEDYCGRGPIEARGLNMELQKGDIAFRANFATVDKKLIVTDRRAGRIRSDTGKLANSLDGLEIKNESGKVDVLFSPATEHRAVLVLRGKGLSAQISDSDPLAGNAGEKIRKIRPLNNSIEARRTADIANSFTEKALGILNNHPVNKRRRQQNLLPANAILLRSAGKMKDVQNITQKYGIKVACITAESTVKGVARMAGFDVYSKPGMTANLDTDVMLKGNLALEILSEYDLIFIHVKGTDLNGHDNQPLGKVKMIENVDKMVALLWERTEDDIYIGLTSDHTTPCEAKIHTGEPVPVAINGPGVRRDRVRFYNEIDCASGGLNRITGMDFFRIIVNYMGVNEKCGS